MLSPADLREVRRILRRHFLAIIQESVGTGELTADERAILEAAGILGRSGGLLVDDPYHFGRLLGMLGGGSVASLGVAEVEHLVAAGGPLTEVERGALNFARLAVGQNIRGVMDLTLRGVTSVGAAASGAALRAIQDATATAVSERKTASQLRSTLWHLIDNRFRDWQRVAHTEMHDAIQHGIRDAIRDNSPSGVDQLVFKRPNPDACKYCKGLYLKRDGLTPRIFKLSYLAATNVGLRASAWRPVIGSTHPWCNCQLEMVPTGYDFETRWTVGRNFEEGGKKYKRGAALTEAEYRQLMVAGHEPDLDVDAMLGFTGTTGAPEILRSESSLPISGQPEDEPTCECI